MSDLICTWIYNFVLLIFLLNIFFTHSHSGYDEDQYKLPIICLVWFSIMALWHINPKAKSTLIHMNSSISNNSTKH